MVECNQASASVAEESKQTQKTFEQILAESGYSPDQVRGIADELAAKRLAVTKAEPSQTDAQGPTPQTKQQS